LALWTNGDKGKYSQTLILNLINKSVFWIQISTHTIYYDYMK